MSFVPTVNNVRTGLKLGGGRRLTGKGRPRLRPSRSPKHPIGGRRKR